MPGYGWGWPVAPIEYGYDRCPHCDLWLRCLVGGSRRGHLSDPVVNSHEVGVLREFGDDFSRVHPLSLTCYLSDRHEALLWGSVHPALDLVECFREIPNGKGLAETSTPFVPLSVAFTSSFPVGVGLVSGCIGGQLVR
jgi:hypothetical protein